jgi:glutaredoxin
MTAPVNSRSFLGLVLLVAAAMAGSSWWASHSRASVGEQVAALARPGDIRMLSSVTCPSCTVARRWLQEHQVPHTECLIERDPACLAEFQARLAPGTPVIVVKGRPQLGFSPDRLLAALQADRPAGT